jgi:hypothetical protein
VLFVSLSSKPVLQAMVLADNVYQDRLTGKFIIAGTFSRLGITRRLPPLTGGGPSFPSAPPSPSPPAVLLENAAPMYASATPVGPPQPAAAVPQAPAPGGPGAPGVPGYPGAPPAGAAPVFPPSAPPPAPSPPAGGTPASGTPAETTTFRSAAELTRAVSSAGSPHLYIALTDVHRTIPLRVRFVDLSDITEAVSRFEIGLEVNSPDPLAVTELVIPMPRLPVTGAGTFSIDLLYQGEILGSWRIVVTEELIQG